MRILRGLDQLRNLPATAMAIGCFDGVHRAHQVILQSAIAGKSQGLVPAVFTFDTNPDDNSKGAPLLMTEEEKLRVFEALGVELVCLVPFSQVRDFSPEAFVSEVLARCSNAKRVYCGYNFHFGKGGRANTETLRALCEQEHIELTVVEKLQLGDQPVSSTRIRALIESGGIREANELLGRPFSLELPVVHGKQLGRKIGVPTMNQKLPDGFVRPKHGVYCSETIVDGKAYCSVTNIGRNPTVGGTQLSVETWIQDFSGDLYDQCVRISLLEFLREEQKFPSLTALQEQIFQDKAAAEHFYHNSR